MEKKKRKIQLFFLTEILSNNRKLEKCTRRERKIFLLKKKSTNLTIYGMWSFQGIVSKTFTSKKKKAKYE